MLLMDCMRVGGYVQRRVIQTKSVEYMPLFLSITLLLNSICWTAYALVRFDLYLTAVVDPGIFLASANITTDKQPISRLNIEVGKREEEREEKRAVSL